MSRTALVTGVTGQDGSYLADLLLDKGYDVWSIVRRTATPDHWRISSIEDQLHVVEADLLDQGSLVRAIEKAAPDEIYNLAAMSYVPVSWEEPVSTTEVTGLGVVRLLEAMRITGSNARFYQAGSSEQFGNAEHEVQDERTRFCPRSPYGFAKVLAHNATVNYRESYGMFACCGILFNHESPRRGKEFVTRKISLAAARISQGKQSLMQLGNLDAKRDWGYAPEYVEAMWRMLQQPEPKDYVIATGEMHSVREFATAAFNRVGLDWHDYVLTDKHHNRPAELHSLCGNASAAEADLGWVPNVKFNQLVDIMVDADLSGETIR